MTSPIPGPRQQRGQSLVEFCVVVPTFLFLLLAIFQFVLIYRAKSTLDYATLEAARSGAVNGARMGDIRAGLAGGLTPLFATSPDVAGVAKARLKAEADARLFTKIEIISPTKKVWNEFRERGYDGKYALPNDSLAFRRANVGANGVNVQDANLLKVKVTYRFPLIVPFVDRVIAGLSNLVRGDSRDDIGLGLTGGPRLAIESYAIVRMQSPINDNSSLPNN